MTKMWVPRRMKAALRFALASVVVFGPSVLCSCAGPKREAAPAAVARPETDAPVAPPAERTRSDKHLGHVLLYAFTGFPRDLIDVGLRIVFVPYQLFLKSWDQESALAIPLGVITLPLFLVALPVAGLDSLLVFAGTEDTWATGLQCNLPANVDEGWFGDGMHLFPNFRSYQFFKPERIAHEP